MYSPTVRQPGFLRVLNRTLLGSLLLLVGCGGHFVARGQDLYTEGRFVEAAEVFERTETRLAVASSTEQARFGLYRGATFLKLGDVEHAARWLGYARSVVKREPGALGAREVALLDAALEQLAHGHPSPPSPESDAALTARRVNAGAATTAP